MIVSDAVVRALSDRLSEPEWFLDRRLEALEKFQQLRMPREKYGIRMLVDLSSYDISHLNPFESLGEDYVDAPEGVEVCSFAEAFEEYDEILREYFMTQVAPTEDKITALHAALFGRGLLIRIPSGMKVSRPIRIRSVQEDQLLMRHILVIAEEGSSVSIVEEYAGVDSPVERFASTVVEVIVKDHAVVEYHSADRVSRNAYAFIRRKARVEKSGAVVWKEFVAGGKFVRSFTNTSLVGGRARVEYGGGLFGSGLAVYDVLVTADHEAPHTESTLSSRSVLDDESRLVFRGLVKMRKGMNGCVGSQREDVLLVSSLARVDTVPVLEIGNCDVSSSHAASVGELDPEVLFYLMSRGLSDSGARREVVQGYLAPLCTERAMHDALEAVVQEWRKK